MIVARRSFVKSMFSVLSMLPLPGSLGAIAASIAPEDVDDVDDILSGLIARCVRGPIGAREAALVGSFLSRFDLRKDRAMIKALAAKDPPTYTERDVPKEEIPVCVRFITETVRGLRRGPDGDVRPKPWWVGNFKELHRAMMPRVVAAYEEDERERRKANFLGNEDPCPESAGEP